MNVSILSIGTELTTGQIINRNSAWIAAQLKSEGIESRLHLTVPDEKKLMLDAMNFCADQSEVIMITGGLGPTSDDFTRNIVAEWLKLDLVFHEESWIHLNEVLSQRSVPVKSIQKQQCYFPETAEVLKNRKGTANGFSIQKSQNNKSIQVFVLPGPPLEIEAIWSDYIGDWLKKKTQHLDKIKTRAWDLMGLPESEVATLTEDAIKEMKKDFPFTVGYRVHLPYVEVKISYPTSVEFTATAYVQKVEKALQPYTVLRNFEKAPEIFSQLISKTSFAFYDFCTRGYLNQTLAPYLEKQPEWHWKQSEKPMDADFFNDEENFISLWNQDEKSCSLMADFKGKKFSTTFEIPARFLSMPERKAQYFAQMALIEFIKHYKL